ncbi:cytochrome P450 [Mycolicibacillus parakoreensis]|uniref:Cytochrome P450 n=1 Tax=Mycolicibacillus parakoreensis TaxID=1069221 RepID=A0ABY3TX60_9MYCO|nr:cytochrome P450 [Mycolicibacillus parakoreensis]MCV7315757.1 cytochrome P450 [Mycolicibacillus parakoreensis]ULN51812.1 cytochrome P450 [Mycolicibacillus parakoreensis]
MTTISTPHYLLDQAKRRFVPTLNTIPGMGTLEKALLNVNWKQRTLAAPPPGSDLKPVRGDSGLPLLGHIIEMFRGGPDYAKFLYETRGPVTFADSPILPSIVALGPDATQTVFANRAKDFSQQGWVPVIGPFFNRGLMLLDFDEHLGHKRIMQQAFTRPRLASYVADIDRVASAIVADWPTDDPRFLVHPAMKELTLDVASVVFMGHEPGSDHELVTKVNKAFEQTTRAGGAIIRTAVPPFKWWQGLQGRKVLEQYFAERVTERRHAEGTDMLTALCHVEDEDGNSFTDDDIINHMIFLMMAAHDTTTSTVTTMAYHLAAYPDWQERARAESDALGDGALDIEALENLTALDLVMDESLRLVTPLPFNMRQTVRDTDLLGYHVPAGTNLVIWPGANHWLDELYTEPKKFDPERFLPPREEHKKHRYAWAPFGGGAHKCIGMVFGRLEIKTVLHRMLRRYRIELAHPGYQPRWDYAGMPLPMDGMPLVLRRR